MIENTSSSSPKDLAREMSMLALEDDTGVVDKLCLDAINAMPEEAEVIRRGNVRVLKKLVGFVMRHSKGRADAQAVQARLQQLISSQQKPS